jgi:hypothetical protein
MATLDELFAEVEARGFRIYELRADVFRSEPGWSVALWRRTLPLTDDRAFVRASHCASAGEALLSVLELADEKDSRAGISPGQWLRLGDACALLTMVLKEKTNGTGKRK